MPSLSSLTTQSDQTDTRGFAVQMRRVRWPSQATDSREPREANLAREPAGGRTRSILIAHPSADVYGSDLQLLETVTGLVERGWRVVVVVPAAGPLVSRMRDRGADVRLHPFPVLRRAHASARGVAALAWAGGRFAVSGRRLIKAVSADTVLVNTVTIPWWIVAGRLAGVPTTCHVHEAATEDHAIIRSTMATPLLAASRVVVLSRAVLEATCRSVPGLRRRSRLVYNGVPGPSVEPAPPREHAGPYRLLVISRLSPGKSPDTAIRALALLRDRGTEATLDIAGTSFAGYEWYEQELHCLAAELGVSSAISWHGYVSPVWELLSSSDVVIAPSLREGFGNVVVEAQLAARPVIAAAVDGHLETVTHGQTGLLFPARDAEALASGIQRICQDQALAVRLAQCGRKVALRRFSPERYRAEVARVVAESCGLP